MVSLYGMSHTILFDTVWQVVEAADNLEEFKFLYPECQRLKEAIAHGFAALNDNPLTNCAGAVNGVLIWTNKAIENDTFVARLGDGKFNCEILTKLPGSL